MNPGLNNAIPCITITAGIILTTPARAAEEQYLSAQLAFSDVSTRPSLSNGTALVATYGRSLPQLHEYLGVEAEYTTSVKKPEYDTPANHAEFDYYTAALYALMTFPVAEKVSLRARAGVLYENWNFRDNVLGNASDKAVDFSIGGGAIYDLNEDLTSSPRAPSSRARSCTPRQAWSSVAARTSDGQEIFLDASMIYGIDPAQVVNLHIVWQNRYTDELVRPLMRGIIRDAVSQYGVQEVYSTKRALMTESITEALRQKLADNGMILTDFELRNITFSPEYAASVEQKQIAEQQAQQAKFVVEQRKQEAEQARQQAQGLADAVVIRAQGAGQARVIEANAEASALEVVEVEERGFHAGDGSRRHRRNHACDLRKLRLRRTAARNPHRRGSRARAPAPPSA